MQPAAAEANDKWADSVVINDDVQEEASDYLRSFLRRPADPIQPDTAPEVASIVNRYFTACDDSGIRPSITGLVLALGLSSVTMLERWGRRRPDLRYALGRALVAVAHTYEMMIGTTAPAGPLFILKNLPDGFDPEEREGTPAPIFWNDTKRFEIEENITGIISVQRIGAEIDPAEAYARVIQGERLIYDDAPSEASTTTALDRPAWLDESAVAEAETVNEETAKQFEARSLARDPSLEREAPILVEAPPSSVPAQQPNELDALGVDDLF